MIMGGKISRKSNTLFHNAEERFNIMQNIQKKEQSLRDDKLSYESSAIDLIQEIQAPIVINTPTREEDDAYEEEFHVRAPD